MPGCLRLPSDTTEPGSLDDLAPTGGGTTDNPAGTEEPTDGGGTPSP